jgi:tetratricopeptide (TPR) repeat protein
MDEVQRSTMKNEYVRALNNMAVCCIRLGEWVEAKANFDAVLVIDSSHVKANFLLGKCYFELHNYLDSKSKFQFCLT